MNRYNKVMFILAGVLITSGISISYSADWHITTVKNDDDGFGFENVHIRLDSEDRPYITFNDEWWDGVYEWYDYLKYAYWTGDSWDIASIDVIYGIFNDTSLALDSRDYPLIAYTCLYYTGNKQYGSLLLATWTGSDWDIQDVCEELEPSPDLTSLAVDSLDHPNMVFNCREDGPSPGLNYAQWSGSVWNTQAVDSETNLDDGSIKVDSENSPHIAYITGYSNRDLKYAELVAGTWSVQVLDSGYLSTASLVLDSMEFPHITYRHDGVKYYYWDGATWVFETVDASGDDPSLALDSLDVPHIAYTDSADALKYAHKIGDSWEITTFDDTHAHSLSLTLDSQDNPHICFYDYVLEKLRYLWYGDPLTDISLQSFTTNYVAEEIVVQWSVSDFTSDEQIAGFNLYRREMGAEDDFGSGGASDDGFQPIQNEATKTWSKINSRLITGENPYEYTDSDVHGGFNYEYRLEAVLADQSTEVLGTASCATTPTSFAITKLYPNPASDHLACLLSVPNVGLVELGLYDLSGRLVACQKLEVAKATELEAVMDVSSLASGVYILQATYGDAQTSILAVVAR